MSVRVTLIGFGEAGQAFAQQGGWGVGVRVYDKLTDQPETREAKQRDYAAAGVQGVESPGAAAIDASIILSLVTADQALVAAASVLPQLRPGALYFDFNSVVPQTKREAADLIEKAGGHYVDVAVMAPVLPKGLQVPLLISGRHSADGREALRKLGFEPRIVEGDVGKASTIKMLRSVMVKGIEALSAECFLAAEVEGVAAEVARSLDESDGQKRWSERVAYNLERMRRHGLRRAAEMDEAAKTIEAIRGTAPMSRATAAVQRDVADNADRETSNEAEAA